jgi:predicted enzyme related to lactoylglutathione lyase
MGVHMANTIDWVEIQTGDIETTSKFYQEVFGWKEMEREVVAGSQVRILDTDGEPRLQNLRRAGIVQRSKDNLHGIVVYIKVDNLEATLRKAMELGARLASPKTELPGGYSVTFYDPSGNMMALYQDKKQ